MAHYRVTIETRLWSHVLVPNPLHRYVAKVVRGPVWLKIFNALEEDRTDSFQDLADRIKRYHPNHEFTFTHRES